jgi:exopolysaccharide production protein ExoQ
MRLNGSTRNGERLLVSLTIPCAILVASLFLGYEGAAEPQKFLMVAGLICLPFVLYVVHSRPIPAISLAFFLVLIAETKFRGRDPTASLSSEVDSQIKFELLVYGFLGLALLTLLYQSRFEIRLRAVEMLLLAYIGLALVSLVWSPVPQLTLVRAGQMGILFGLAVVAHRMLPADRLLRALSAAILVYVLLSTMVAVLHPGAMGGYVTYAGSRRFSWFSVHPIKAATTVGIAGLLALSETMFRPHGWRTRRFGIPLVLYIPVLVAILAATNSRGPTAAFLAGVGALVVRKHLRAWSVFALLAFTIALVVFFSSRGETAGDLIISLARTDPVVAELILRGQSVTALEGLSGRMELWEKAWPLITENPILGLGFQGSRSALLEVAQWAGNAHNALLQTLLDLGVVGTVVLWGTLAYNLVITTTAPVMSQETAWPQASAFAIAVFLAVNSFSSQSFTGPPGYEWLLLVTSVVLGEYATATAATKRARRTSGLVVGQASRA